MKGLGMVKNKRKNKTKNSGSGDTQYKNPGASSSAQPGEREEADGNQIPAQHRGNQNDTERRTRNLEILQNEFPTLDTSLVLAIHSDTPLDLEAARGILSTLANVTVLGEADDLSPYDDDNTTTETSSTWVTTTSTADESSQTTSEDIDELVQTKDEKVRGLKELFPTLPDSVISNALEKSKGIIDAAADVLFNYDVTGNSSVPGSNSEENGAKAGRYYLKGLDDVEYFPGGKSCEKKFRNGRRNEKRIFPERDGQADYTVPLSPNSVPYQDVVATSLLPLGAQMSAWDRLQSEASFLSYALNLPSSPVSSAYHKHNGSLSETIYYLLDQYASTPSLHRAGTSLSTDSSMGNEIGQDEENLEYVDQFADLIEIFPDLEENDLWRLLKRVRSSSDTKRGQKCRSSQQEDMENLFRIAEFLRENPRQKRPSASPMIATSSMTTTTTSSPTTVAAEPEFVTINSRSSIPSSSTQSHLPYMHNLNLQCIHTARDNALSNAYRQYRKSNRSHGAAASYYSIQASQLSSLARTHFPASTTSWEKLHNLGGYKQCSTHTTLDLHGLTLPEAIHVTQKVVEGWWKEENEWKELTMEKRIRPLIVITGLGRHSPDGRGVLGVGIVRVLRTGGWRLEWHSGEVRVTGRERGR